MDAKQRRDHLFIVKIWQEPGASDAPAEAMWRGSVQHVQSDERIYFRRLADLNEFMRSQVSRQLTTPPGREDEPAS